MLNHKQLVFDACWTLENENQCLIGGTLMAAALLEEIKNLRQAAIPPTNYHSTVAALRRQIELLIAERDALHVLLAERARQIMGLVAERDALRAKLAELKPEPPAYHVTSWQVWPMDGPITYTLTRDKPEAVG